MILNASFEEKGCRVSGSRYLAGVEVIGQRGRCGKSFLDIFVLKDFGYCSADGKVYVLENTPFLFDYLNFIICSSAPNLLFLSTSSFTLSFSNFSSYSNDRLLINSVKAASCICSKGVNFSFLSSSDHLDCASMPSMRFQSGLASDPRGALEYRGRFSFFSSSSSLSLSYSFFLVSST